MKNKFGLVVLSNRPLKFLGFVVAYRGERERRDDRVAQWSLKKEDTKAIFKKHMRAGARRTDTSRCGAWDLIQIPKSEKPLEL